MTVDPERPQGFMDQVRARVRGSGMSAQRVADGARIHKSAMSRFLSGERSLSEAALDRLAAYLGLRVVGSKRRRRGR